jgi:ELWxxDGT repeat protein
MCSSSLRRGALALLLLSVSSLCQAGLAPRLVRDIDETSYAGSSSPREFSGVEHGMAFTAFGGRELWIYDNRSDAYHQRVVNAQIRQVQGPYYAIREADGWSFWLADGFPGFGLYPLGGKFKGRLGTIYPSNSWWESPVLFEGDAGKGRGLWTLGPVELARPLPLEDGRLLRDWTPGRKKGYFIARHRTLGTALWKTDWTKAGTSVVTAPSPGQTIPLRIAGFLRNRLLLTISGSKPELWWSDGSPRGLRPFLQIGHGPKGATVSAARVVNGRAFFVAADPNDRRPGRQLWTSDGTQAGTFPVTSFAPDPLRQIDVPALAKDGVWYFVADDGIHGREVWRTDGTRQGTRLVIDLCPGSCSSDPRDFSLRISSGSHAVYLTASNAEGLRALWQTDGTAPGTVRLTPPDVEATTGMLFQDIFDARTADLGEEMWATGGTPGSTGLLVDLGLEEDSGSHPFPLGAAGDRLIFQTQAPTVENGLLWASDGTAAGTHPIPAPPELGLDDYRYLPTTSLGARLLLVAPSPPEGSGLWAFDGTEAGGVRLTPPGVNLWSGVGPVVVGAGGTRALFVTLSEPNEIELWVTEGTPETTHLFLDLPQGSGVYSSPDRLLRGQLVFQMASTDDARHLWLTDGTLEGTHPLTDTYPFLAPLELSNELTLVEAGGKLFFFGSTEAGGESRLWVSDGTAAGTVPLEFAESAGYVETLIAAGSHVYFTIFVDDPNGPNAGSHLWVTDGTPAGTVPLPGRPIISFYSDFMRPVPFGDRLLFVHGSDYHFWVTDGTAAGTFPLRDPEGHAINQYQGHATVFHNQLAFGSLDYEANGGACYVWDGTGATARQLENLSCGAFLPVRDRLFFSGFQPKTGAELWVLEDR